MKGIVLAGGQGSRLHPITLATSKQLLPIYDKPMIYYPISILMLANITDILIITTPEDEASFKRLLGDGSQFGIKLSYAKQEKPKGIADAFLIGESFIGTDDVCLILGDNIYYGHGLPEQLNAAIKNNQGGTVFGYRVQDPERFGVAECDDHYNVLSLEEKPKNPKSDIAVTGLYIYDNTVISITKNLNPSPRGELEITDVNKEYLKQQRLKLNLIGRGIAWLDTGTQKSLLEASRFVEVLQEQQGLKISCLEEIAFRKNLISKESLLQSGNHLKNTDYGQYLIKLANS